MSLELKNIKKSYRDKEVLKGIDASMTNGIYGFLGANGVGKTTLFKIISGYITNFQGQLIYPKINEKKELMLGFLPQTFDGYPDMTIYEFLAYLGNIKSDFTQKKIDGDIGEKLDLFNLTDLKDKKLKKLSGGQRRRVGLAQAFLLNPRIVMLDEPTTGLDPTERIKFKNYITDAGHDQILLISTHIVSDLEYIAKEIFILQNGHFVMAGPEKELISKCEGLVWEAKYENEMDLHKRTKDMAVSMIYDFEGGLKARIISKSSPNPSAVPVKPTLNDVYLVNFKKEATANAE